MNSCAETPGLDGVDSLTQLAHSSPAGSLTGTAAPRLLPPSRCCSLSDSPPLPQTPGRPGRARMETLLESPRPLGEESLQMWDLNKRLEAYLARVKFLEEENEGLKSEIHCLRGSPGAVEDSWRGRYEEEVAAWRARLDEAFREKSAAELARAGLCEELQRVQGRCQRERAARQEARELLALSRKALEEEKRGHIWLRERATQLEKEAEALLEAHEEERARLEQEVAAFSSWGLETFRGGSGTAATTPAAFQPVEVEDYSQRLSSIWQGAVETYKAEVSRLEASFGEAKENLWKATERNRQNQLQLQHLERELAGLKGRKETLEEHLAQQWHHQQGEAKKLQLAAEGLEEEKEALSAQIAQVLEDRRQLMHLKTSLSLEVATYRTLLEAESTRLLQRPADPRLALSLPDGKLEASARKRQTVSLERGNRGHRDPRPTSAAFLKGGVAPQLPKNQSGPLTVHTVSVLPKSRSPVLREFQKASAALQSQSAKALEGASGPAFIDSAALQLGSSSQQSEMMTAGKAGTVSQSSAPEPPCFPALVPNVLGESSSNPEQSHPPEEDGEENSAQTKTRELGEKAELREEVEEEEKLANEEPPWKTTLHRVPHPSPQLATEASGAALQEAHAGEVRFEAGWLGAAETPNGIPSDDSSSVEEGNGAAASPGTAAFEEAMPGLLKSHMEGLLEGVPGSEDSREINGGDPEVCSEQQEEAAAVWVPRDAEPSSRQETRLLEEERSPSTQRDKDEVVFDIPVVGRIDGCNEMSSPEQTEVGGGERPPPLQGIVQRGESPEGVQGTRSAGQLDTGAAAVLRDDWDSPQPGTSGAEDHTGATGPDVEETDGGAEDLDVVSTEALHLSEDEERRALSSPSRESEECDFQAEMLEREFLQAEEFVVETLSPPISHSFYSAESHQDHHFLGTEQEAPEEETSLSKTDYALPEEEGKEVDSEPETPRVEEEAALRDDHSTNTWTAEPKAKEEEAGAEEPQQDIWGREGLLEEEDALCKEDTMQKKETATLQDWTWEHQTVLQQENVESVLRQEMSTRDQGEETVEVCQGDLPMAQQVEEEEIITQGGEETVDALQGGDLPVDQQMEDKEITAQGEETVEVCQGDLPMAQQVEEEEIITQGDQGEETVDALQGEDLSIDQQMEDKEIAIQGEETVEVCQGHQPMAQQVEEEEIITQGDQGEETVDVLQGGDLPVDQQMEDKEIATQGEETLEACEGGDLPVDHQVEDKEIAIQGAETVEACERGDLPMDQQMEDKEIAIQGEETVEVCQGHQPMEQQMEDKEIATQGEETVEVCQGDLPMDQQMEDKEIATRGEETVEAREGRDLPVDQQVEDKEIATQGEETVEACQGDLPMDQQMEDKEIATQGEETVEACEGGDLPVEQQMEDKEIATQGEETVEMSEGDLPVEQQMEDKEITAQREQGEETGEACPGDLPVEEQAEEEGIAMASAERDVLNGGDLIAESEATETEESKTSLVGNAETMGCGTRRDLQEEENPEANLVSKTDTRQAEEQHATLEREETCPNQHSLHCDQSLPHEAGPGALEAPSEARDHTASGLEAKSDRGPQETDASSGRDHPLQSGHSGSGVSLESLDVSPDTTHGREGIEAELESRRQIELEETLPDSTPLHLYDGKMLAVTGKGQPLPEDEGAAEAPVLTKDSVTSAEATGQAVEEAALCPDSSQEGDGDAKVWEGVDEEGGGHMESAPKQKSPSSEDLLASRDLEEAETESWELIRGDEEGLPAEGVEMPGPEDRFPPLDAEVDEQPGEIVGCGSGARKELACGEVAREESGSPDFVWETERDNIFQPDPSYVQERFQGGNDSPLGFSEPSHTVPEGSHKVSPLTSVADLGEIVLEEEQSADGQEDGAEAEGFVYCGEERGPCVHDSQPVSGLENCSGEEPTRPTDLPELSSSGTDSADPSLKAEASLPVDSLRDSDILEIVEQALEFSQEAIWAAERTVGAEKRAAQGDVLCSPVSERNGSSPLALPDVGRSQVPAETPRAPSPDAKDSAGSSHLGAEDNGNGLQQDPSLADFTAEVLNGLGGLHSGNGGERIEGLAARQHFCRQGPGDQYPPQARVGEEAPRTGDVRSETHEKDSPEYRGQEGGDVAKSLFAHRMKAAHLKGKDAEVEADSIPSHFGEEILHPESSQPLKFRPEEEDELWSPEDQ